MLSFFEHRIIQNYVFGFFKINLNFKRNYYRTLFYEKKNAFNLCICAFFLTPNLINVYGLMHSMKAARLFTLTTSNRFEDYVTLTRVNFSPVIKTWCDWCSICNGYFAFLVDAINEFYQEHDVACIKYNNYNLIKLKIISALTTMIVKAAIKSERHLIQSVEYLDREILFPGLYDKSPHHIRTLIDVITELYNCVHEAELLCCPFLSMQKIARRAKQDQNAYQEYKYCESFADVVKAGELLFKFRHIKCKDCAKVLNEQLDSAPVTSLDKNVNAYFNLCCQIVRRPFSRWSSL